MSSSDSLKSTPMKSKASLNLTSDSLKSTPMKSKASLNLTSDSLKSTPMKSKASLKLTSKSPISKTPDKQSSQLSKRVRKGGVALSIKEIGNAAQTRSKSPTEQIKSARKQIFSWPAESPSPKKSYSPLDKLPEKYEILCEFFNSLDSAIRLLRLKGSVPTFTNINPKIECLTDRRFLYCHLAQLKHILPEAIETKSMLVFDEKTSCMKPDLHISIIVDAIDYVDNLKSETKNLKLRKVFRARLVDYINAHPEGDEIPEEDLPEPFNLSNQTKRLNMMKESVSLSSNESSIHTLTEQQSFSVQGEVVQEKLQQQPSNCSKSNLKCSLETFFGVVNDRQPVVASHVSPLFRKRFSLKATSKAQEAVQASLSVETTVAPTPVPAKILSKPTTAEAHPKSCLPATPVKELNQLKTEDESSMKASCIQSTPVKLPSTPARLMTATPTLQQKKRCYMSPDEVSATSSNKLVRRPPRTRSLKFDTPMKEEKNVGEVHEMEDKPVDNDEDDALSILPESPDEVSATSSNKLVRRPPRTRSLKFDTPMKEEKDVGEVHEMADKPVDNDEDDALSILTESLRHSIKEKERKAMEEQDPAISQAKRRQRMIACLPKLFHMILYLFQSIKRSVITKEELMHKLIAGHCDIADRGEVEEQLKLLQELAPEWISEKMAFAGDLLVCINKVSSPESIRTRLKEAT